MPRRGDLDPLAFPSLLSHIWLLEYVASRNIYIYRLAGEHINEIFGFSLRGKSLSQVIPEDMLEIVRNRFEHVRRAPGACHAKGCVYLRVGRYRSGERLILPLADENGVPGYILGATIYRIEESPAGSRPCKPEMQETKLSLGELAAWEPELLQPS